MLYARPRPEPFFDLIMPTTFSFPSGHALGSVCFYGIVAWIIATRAKSAVFRWSAPPLLALLILLVGISRIYLGYHYPTDVIAGLASGAVWVACVSVADRYFLKRETK